MVKYKCKYGHSKFSLAGNRYETEPDGIIMTDDKKIIDFLDNNFNFVCLEQPPTPATTTSGSVKPPTTGAKKNSKKK